MSVIINDDFFEFDIGGTSSTDTVVVVPGTGGGGGGNTNSLSMLTAELKSPGFDGSITRANSSMLASAVKGGMSLYINATTLTPAGSASGTQYPVLSNVINGSNRDISFLADGQILVATIASSTTVYVSSETSISTGTAGWLISAEGNSVFNNVYVRGQITATSGSFTGFMTAGNLRIGSDVNSTNDGIYINANNYWYDTGNFAIGNGTSGVTWNGTTLAVTGTITATLGTIGGFTIGSTSLTAGSGSTSVGLNTTGFPFYAGNATPGSAPFRVTSAGALTATSATITGTVNASAGNFTSNVTIGSGATSGTLTVGTSGTSSIKVVGTNSTTTTAIYDSTSTGYQTGEFWLDASGRFSLGASTDANALSWNGTSLVVRGDITATGGSFTGTVNIASSGTLIAGSVTNGTVIDATGLYGYEQGIAIFKIPTTSSALPQIARFTVVDTAIYSNGLDANLIVGTRGYAGVGGGSSNTIGTVTQDATGYTAEITGVGTTYSNFIVGQAITGSGGNGTIPLGTYVLKVTSNTKMTIASPNQIISGTVTTITGTGGYNITLRGQDDGGSNPTTPAAIFTTINGVTTSATADNGFYVDRTGKFRLAGANGSVTMDGSGNLSVTGQITATSGSFTGYMTAGNLRIGSNVNSTNEGIYINANNYWYDSGSFSIGNGTSGVTWNGTTLAISGTVTISGTAASTVVSNASTGAAKPNVYSQTTQPTGTIPTGSVWYDTDDNNKTYVYNGSSWVVTETNAAGVGLGNVSNLTPQNQAQTGLIAGTTITGGGITLSNGGSIKGGQTDYNTGTGFFIGYSGSAYKFSIGNASSKGITWDGTSLTIGGDVTIGSTLASTVVSNAATGSTALQPGSAASDVNNNVTTISGDKIRTGTIESTGYAYTSGNFSDTGTQINLSDGLIRSKNFLIDSSGNAFLNGTINATAGTFGSDATNKWTIGSEGISYVNSTVEIPNGIEQYDSSFENGTFYNYWVTSTATEDAFWDERTSVYSNSTTGVNSYRISAVTTEDGAYFIQDPNFKLYKNANTQEKITLLDINNYMSSSGGDVAPGSNVVFSAYVRKASSSTYDYTAQIKMHFYNSSDVFISTATSTSVTSTTSFQRVVLATTVPALTDKIVFEISFGGQSSSSGGSGFLVKIPQVAIDKVQFEIDTNSGQPTSGESIEAFSTYLRSNQTKNPIEITRGSQPVFYVNNSGSIFSEAGNIENISSENAIVTSLSASTINVSGQSTFSSPIVGGKYYVNIGASNNVITTATHDTAFSIFPDSRNQVTLGTGVYTFRLNLAFALNTNFTTSRNVTPRFVLTLGSTSQSNLSNIQYILDTYRTTSGIEGGVLLTSSSTDTFRGYYDIASAAAVSSSHSSPSNVSTTRRYVVTITGSFRVDSNTTFTPAMNIDASGATSNMTATIIKGSNMEIEKISNVSTANQTGGWN